MQAMTTENMSAATPTQTPTPQALALAEMAVHGLYRHYLGRAPDDAGLRHWMQVILNGAEITTVQQTFLHSPEYLHKAALHTQQTEQHARQASLKQQLATKAANVLANRPLTIVDVGAQELEDERHVYAPLLDAQLPHQIIGFEPLQEKLEASRLRHPDGRIKLYPTFIGDGQSHLFHINQPDATSSLLPFNHELTQQLVDLSHLRTVHTETVHTSTLDVALADIPYVDFLKLDIQGFELPALQHAQAVLARCNVVHCEVSFAPIYQGQALFAEVETLLRAQGFYFVDFSSLCHYPYHTQGDDRAKTDVALRTRDRLGWGDAVFFKQAARCTTQDLLVQSLIAMLVYNKFTLAESLADSLADSIPSAT
jgi:FkbM family methyltransferase